MERMDCNPLQAAKEETKVGFDRIGVEFLEHFPCQDVSRGCFAVQVEEIVEEPRRDNMACRAPSTGGIDTGGWKGIDDC